MADPRADNPRQEKVAIVTEVKERLESSDAVVVTEYRGLTVKALAELRTALRPVGGSYKVYKNTLVRRAADDAGIDLAEHLVGPTALAFTGQTPDGEPGDVVTVAKVLRDFARTNPDLLIKGGYFDGQAIDAEGVRALADVEPREVLLAKLAGLMAAPMQQLAGLLQALPRDFAYGLQALIDKGGASDAPEGAGGASDAPAASAEEAQAGGVDDPTGETPADETPADETTENDQNIPADEAAQNIPADEAAENEEG